MSSQASVPPQPHSRDRDRLVQLLLRFRMAREQGSATDLSVFLPPSNDPIRTAALDGLVRIDLEFRLRLGDAPAVEDYLEQYPELAQPSERLIDLLRDEFCLRRDLGDDPLLDSYRGRFPGQFDAFRSRLGDEVERTSSVRNLPSLPPPDERTPISERGSSAGRSLTPEMPESVDRTQLQPAHRRPSSAVPSDDREVSPTRATEPPAPIEPEPPGVSEQVTPVVVTPRNLDRTPRESGLQIGHGYRLFERIGSGGFGEVWRAIAPGGIEVAVKKIIRAVGGREVDLELRALKLIKQLRHPYLVQTQAFWRDGEELYIVMEMCDLNLRQRLKRIRDAGQKALPVEEVLGYLTEASEALDYLHAQSVQHRDIKPDNILLSRGHVKVADFGLARELTRLDPGGLMSASMGGTFIYMAPEVFDGRLSEHSDQFSLAMTFAELRLGRRVCRDQGLMDIMRFMQGGRFDLEPLPQAEQSVLRRALSREPAERFASCTAFTAAWKEACRPASPGRPSRGRPVAPNSHIFPPDSHEGGYRLIELIGRGGFGEVWRAEAPGGVEVAVKRIFQPIEDDGQAQQELDALELTKRLRHPYLVQTQAFWRDGDRLFIVMELCDTSLRDRLKAGQEEGEKGVTAAELLDYFREAAEALDFLHEQGVQHRDVKPDNLLLTEGHIKLADFGLARALSLDSGLANVSFSGTVKYSPPEAFENQLHQHSDQFSLAMAYVELRRGRPLVETSNRFQAMRYIHEGKYELDDLPEVERPILARALARDPEKRFPSCTAFVAALEQAVRPRRTGWFVTAALGLVAIGAAIAAVVSMPQPKIVLPVHCEKIDNETAEDRIGTRYYRHVHRVFADGSRVEFVLIPQGSSRDPQTFYLMRDKVTRALFAAYARDRADLIDTKRAWEKTVPANLPTDNWPVMAVNVFDAQRYAREYAYAELPTKEQWDKASGLYEQPQPNRGPYTGTWSQEKPLAIALDRPTPQPVGTMADDVAQPFGIRDMAGNGFEWTRSVQGAAAVNQGSLLPDTPPRGIDPESLSLRGWSFEFKQPLTYDVFEIDEPSQSLTVPARPWNATDADIGFRLAFVP